MRVLVSMLAAVAIASPAMANNIFETLKMPPKATWRSTMHPDMESCVVLALANRSRQAPTVTERTGETLIIVHDWDSPVPGGKVQGLVTIRTDGTVEFRGQRLANGVRRAVHAHLNKPLRLTPVDGSPSPERA